MYIASAIFGGVAIVCNRIDRPDAKLGWRDPVKLAWANRNDEQPSDQADPADSL
jgi:hypothetical protein